MHKSVENLKYALTLQSNFITLLDLSFVFTRSMTSKYIGFKYLIECLAHKKCSLQTLIVCTSGFTEPHVYHLVLLLVHSHSLQNLTLLFNNLSTGFALFCSGLKMNKCLVELDLALVSLSDVDILLLADVLQQHSKLSSLNLSFSNLFQSTILLQFLQKVFCGSSRSCFSQVMVSKSQYYPAVKQLESYQASRQQNGFPQIQFEIIDCNAEFTKIHK